MTTKITVHRPDARLRSGTFGPLAGLLREAWARRWHIWISYKRDFHAAHAGSGLGLFWNFALPLAPIGAYAGLTFMRAFPAVEGMPPLAYIAVGTTLWFLFTGFITAPMGAVKSQHALVAQTSFPLIGVVVSSLGRVSFETSIRLALALVIVMFLCWPLPLAGLYALALLVPALAFFTACGLLFSMLNLIYPDVGRVIQIALTYLIFVSDVIFPMPKTEAFRVVAAFNPFSVFIDNIRHMLAFGVFANATSFYVMSVIGVALLLIAARVFYVMEWRVRGYSL